jgi:hypothetical protein
LPFCLCGRCPSLSTCASLAEPEVNRQYQADNDPDGGVGEPAADEAIGPTTDCGVGVMRERNPRGDDLLALKFEGQRLLSNLVSGKITCRFVERLCRRCRGCFLLAVITSGSDMPPSVESTMNRSGFSREARHRSR